MVLGLKALFLGTLALIVPVSSQGTTANAKHDYNSYQSERKALVYFSKDTKRKIEKCCGEPIELRAGLFREAGRASHKTSWLSSLRDELSVLRSEICFCSAPSAGTTDLRALISSS